MGILTVVIILTAAAILLALTACSSSVPPVENTPEESRDILKAVTLNTGDSDAHIITLPNGSTLVIDTAFDTSYPQLDAALGGRTVDVLLLTHPHSDHIGGAAQLIRNYDVREVYMIDYEHDSSEYKSLMSALSDKQITPKQAKADESFTLGGVEFRFLGPQADKSYSEINDRSAILQFNFGEHSFLYMGDAEKAAEKDLVAKYGDTLRADVIKIGHHGDDDATKKAFLQQLNSSGYAIITANAKKDPDHANPKTLERLIKYNLKVLRTDLDGDITIISDGTDLSVTTQR